MNRILKAVVFVLAAIYFLMDAIFLSFAKSVANWIAEHWIFESLRVWIVSLPPYPTLALFALPLVILEPVKPMAAYLVGTGHVATGLICLIVSEILKLVLVERLFSVSRNKLMSIPAFAWAYRQYRQVRDWVEATDAWQVVRRWSKIVQYRVRVYVLELKASQKPLRISFQRR